MRHKLLHTLIFVFTFCSFSYSKVLKQQRAAGGQKYDFLYSMDLTKDGGVVVAGQSNSNKHYEKTQNCRDTIPGDYYYGGDFWVVKYNKFGNIEWDKTLGGHLTDACYQVKQTSDGGYIVGGYSYSNAGFKKSQNSKGASNHWLIKQKKW